MNRNLNARDTMNHDSSQQNNSSSVKGMFVSHFSEYKRKNNNVQNTSKGNICFYDQTPITPSNNLKLIATHVLGGKLIQTHV